MTARAEARSAARAEAFQPGHLTWRALASRRHCNYRDKCNYDSSPNIGYLLIVYAEVYQMRNNRS